MDSFAFTEKLPVLKTLIISSNVYLLLKLSNIIQHFVINILNVFFYW